jgi:netrin-G3 ligand
MYTFIGLDPYTEYTVGLTAATEFTTVNADLLKVTTLETAPEDEPVNVTAVSITSTTAILEWGEPITPNGVVVDYHLSYTPGNVSFVVNQSTFVELEDLTPFTQYTVSVRARTQGGVGPPAVVEFQTLEGVPVAPPTIVEASVINSTTATISWEELSTVDLRGNLHHYVVIVEHQGTQVKRIETNETTVPVTGLHRFAQHHITLYAATLGGAGPNVTVSLTTLPTAPDNQSVIVNLTATPLSHSSILITWSPPVKGVNSNITGYQVTWETDTVNLTVEDLQSELYSTRVTYNLTDLTPFTNYTLNVRVLTALGIGAEGDAVTVATYEYTPSKPENISVLNINQPKAAILLSWQPPLKPNGVITMYQYIIGSSVANVSAENMSVMIGDLDYYTDYNVTVVAFTSAGPGEGGTEMFRSSEGPPSAPPTMISLTRVTSQSVEFSWFPPPPGTVNGVLRSYQVEFDRTNHTVPDGTSFQRSGLSPYTNYSFRVAAVTTKVGTFSDISSVRTNFSDDGGPPDNLTAVPVGDSSLNVSWLPPLQPNGPIDGYVISIAIFDGSAMGQSFTARASTLFHLFERLQTHTEYEVTVRASSDEIGEWKNASTIYVFTTNQSVPGLVVSLPSEVLSDSSVVKWTPPTFPNGRILSYRVTCPEQAMKVVHPPNNYITCGQLQPNTTYTASVQAVNYVGDGQTAMITFTTACDYAPPNIDARSEESVRIHLKSCPVNPTFGYVLVVVRKLDGSSTLRPLKSYTIDELVSLTQQPSSRQRRRRGRRQASGPQPYISANLTLNQLASFVLGDGQEYGGYENRVLDSGATYQSTLYGENPTTGKVVVYPSTTFNLTSLSDSPSSPPNIVLYVIIGIAAFISLIILVVVGIIFFVLLSLCRSPSKDNASGGFSRQASFRMSLKKAKVFDPLEVFRGTHSWPSLESHPPVPLSGFHSRMTILQADSNFHFLQEYEAIDIPEQSTYSTEAAVTMVNASKNRYTNIIPFDHSRVKLSPIKGLDGSDYINANFCDGYMKPRAYIATQGPLRNTVEDFWRLVWEQQSYIIVMLTNVQERGKEKCAEYWPLGEMECFGNIDISLESVVALADFTIRTFNVSKTGNPRDVRKVQQFQFTAWPDHGVPMFATSMLAFIRRVQAAMQELPEGAGPMIVHCSAGVGRTGTFIVIDSMTQKIKGGGDSVDVFGHVTLLRTQRNFMVQTEDQYFFIYEAIAEYITCGNTECDMEELPSHVDHLVSIGDGEESAFIELEFKHLALEKNDPNRFGFANESFNKQKNRFVNILPCKDTSILPYKGKAFAVFWWLKSCHMQLLYHIRD